MFQLLKTTALALCVSVLLAAAHADGIWKAEYTSPDGNQRQSTFHLKADGNRLTGKVVSGSGEAELRDGTVTGDDIAFTVIRNFGGNEVTLKYNGKVSDNEIRFKVTFNGENTFDIVAKRQQ
jgi:hypothetical protein